MRTFFDTQNGIIDENNFYIDGVYYRRTWDVVNDVDPLSPGPWDETPEVLGRFNTEDEAKEYLAKLRKDDNCFEQFPRLCIQHNTSSHWVDPRDELRSRPSAKKVYAKINVEIARIKTLFTNMCDQNKWDNLRDFARVLEYVDTFDAADYSDEELENMLVREDLLESIDEYICSDQEDMERVNRIKNAFIDA